MPLGRSHRSFAPAVGSGLRLAPLPSSPGGQGRGRVSGQAEEAAQGQMQEDRARGACSRVEREVCLGMRRSRGGWLSGSHELHIYIYIFLRLVDVSSEQYAAV